MACLPGQRPWEEAVVRQADCFSATDVSRTCLASAGGKGQGWAYTQPSESRVVKRRLESSRLCEIPRRMALDSCHIL